MNRVLSFRPAIENLAREYARTFNDPELIGNILGELITGIASYREEGAKHVPQVFISTDLMSLLLSVKGNDAIPIDRGPISPVTIRSLLKVCGPLGNGHEWGIFIILESNHLQYGVFRTDRFPLHESSFQKLRTMTETETLIIGVQKIGEHLVEIRDSTGRFHYFDSSGSLEVTQNPAILISHWVSAVTDQAPSSLKHKMESFYYRIAIDLLSLAHGTLAAIVPVDQSYPQFLADGVILKERFGLVRAVHRYMKYRDEAATLSLSSYSNLIRKMMSMDGITVFDSSGEVLAYNCFIHEMGNHGPHPLVLGGARKRAFELMCGHLNHELSCVLYRSQDGYGICKKSDRLTHRQSPLLGNHRSSHLE